MPDTAQARAMSQSQIVDRAHSSLPMICWSAVFIGVLVMLIVHFLLNLLGVGVGAAAVSATPAEDDGVGGLLYWSAAGIISSLLGGMAVGKSAESLGSANASLHALIAWGISTLVVVAAVGGVLGAGTTMLGGPLAGDIAELNSLSVQSTGAARVAATASNVRIGEMEEAIAVGAFISFAALLIGAAAAYFGAKVSHGRVANPQAPRADVPNPAR